MSPLLVGFCASGGIAIAIVLIAWAREGTR